MTPALLESVAALLPARTPAAVLASATDASPEIAVWLTPFSKQHALTLTVAVAWGALLIWIGCHLRRLDRRRSPSAAAAPQADLPGAPALEPRYRIALGTLGFVFAAIYHIYWLTPPRFEFTSSLPLHLCDVLSVLAPLSMLVRFRFLQTLAYFWGLGLSTQGFITPVETAGPDHPRFWIFWIAHVQIVGIALYHVVVAGYRPRARDLLIAIAAGALYLAVIMVINETMGLNYGYVGSRENQPGIIAKLGPWPLRVVWMSALAAAGFTILWLPWWAARANPRAPGAKAKGGTGNSACP